VIDAEGAYITPGGVDTHVHLAQDNCPTGDNWETGTRSAVAGGTTTIVAFCSQKKTDQSLIPVLEDYHGRSRGQSYVDYGFHLILTNPTKQILDHELKDMIEKEGISSVKLYMTYEPMKLSDRELLDIMMTTRELGMTTMIHCENSGMTYLVAAYFNLGTTHQH
jgi:dihydropyrimidinase